MHRDCFGSDIGRIGSSDWERWLGPALQSGAVRSAVICRAPSSRVVRRVGTFALGVQSQINGWELNDETTHSRDVKRAEGFEPAWWRYLRRYPELAA